MLRQLIDRLHFHVERWMQRGALNQMLAMAGIIVSVAIVAGIVVAIVEAETSFPDAIWWAFLRLTDPGYLGDDEGAFRRTVSTIVTVAGYVLFMGSLIAIMSQWLRQRMAQLERGLTPIAIRDHVLLVGWTSRTPAIVRELLMSESRVARFLSRRHVRKLRIVVMTEELDSAQATEMREQLGSVWSERKIILRSGTPLRTEHLRRVNAAAAAAIIIPGSDVRTDEADSPDARAVKALLSIADEARATRREYPSIIAELRDSDTSRVADAAYPGTIDIIASDAFLARLIAQNVRHPGLSHVYSELLSYSDGNELYVRHCPEIAGRTFADAMRWFPQAILLGVVRNDGDRIQPCLNPEPDFELRSDDAFILVSTTYTASASSEPGSDDSRFIQVRRIAPPAPPGTQRVLILGWNRKAVSLLKEFDGYEDERFEVDIVSLISASRRERAIHRGGAALGNVRIRQLEADYTAVEGLSSLDAASYDALVFLASEWTGTEEESDARTILGYVVMRELLSRAASRPHVVVELTDPDNARLLRDARDEVIISPVILSHVLAHVALRKELHVVFDELFGPGGAEIAFRNASELGLSLESTTFETVRRRAFEDGEIAFGLRYENAGKESGMVLNPPRDRPLTLGANDEVAVLCSYERKRL